MSYEERMNIDERRKDLHKMRVRYWQAQSRKERSQLLNEMEAVTALHRKPLIRLINGELARKPRRKQWGKSYGAEVKAADALLLFAEFPAVVLINLYPVMLSFVSTVSQRRRISSLSASIKAPAWLSACTR